MHFGRHAWRPAKLQRGPVRSCRRRQGRCLLKPLHSCGLSACTCMPMYPMCHVLALALHYRQCTRRPPPRNRPPPAPGHTTHLFVVREFTSLSGPKVSQRAWKMDRQSGRAPQAAHACMAHALRGMHCGEPCRAGVEGGMGVWHVGEERERCECTHSAVELRGVQRQGAVNRVPWHASG